MATVAQVKSVKVMGRTFVGDEVDNLLVFQNETSGAGVRYSVFKQMGSTSGYQVPASKKLVIWVHIAGCVSGSATSDINVGLAYGDNDVGDATSTAPTTEVNQFRTSVRGTNIGGSLMNNESFMFKNGMGYITKFEVPATKYPHFKATDAAGNVHMAYAIIEDA
jgi:hypothetical protein